jgi:hypothetical protein
MTLAPSRTALENTVLSLRNPPELIRQLTSEIAMDLFVHSQYIREPRGKREMADFIEWSGAEGSFNLITKQIGYAASGHCESTSRLIIVGHVQSLIIVRI